MVCDKCNVEMIKADFTVGGGLKWLSLEVNHEWKDTKHSGVFCYVCKDCGSVKLQASNPENLR